MEGILSLKLFCISILQKHPRGEEKLIALQLDYVVYVQI